MLSDNDLAQVQAATENLTRPVKLLLNSAVPEDPFQRNLFSIARQVAGVSMHRVDIDEGSESAFPSKPSITLDAGGLQNIHYFAAPEGPELAPFLDVLTWLGGGQPIPESEALRSLERVASPVQVLVLMAAACPHCPGVVRKVLSASVRQPLITACIVDAMEFNDLAEQYRVKSTPTIVVNEGTTLVGALSEAQVVDAITRASQGGSLTDIVESMIAAGRADDAAELICREKDPGSILPLYRSQEFAVRMGALVTFEAALELDARSLDPIVGELICLLADADVGLRGDTAELLGKIGDPSAIPALKKAAQDPDPDVREAAEEALEALQTR
ncbi:MAG: HEAT repeat domain-containing protein [Thermodesulfobacteriota bacterium]